VRLKSKYQVFLENLLFSSLSLIKILVTSKKVVIKGINQKADLVILGNGPSFKSQIADYFYFLQNKDLICVNHFPKTDFYEKLKPAYYVTSAPDLWLDDIDEKFVISSKQLFKTMASKTTWPLHFFIPYEAKQHLRWQEQLKFNNNIKIFFYNNTPVEGFNFISKILFNLKLGMPRPHNVMIPCLMIAIWLNYNKIFLWGTDHSWLKEITVDKDNNVLLNQKHFYDETTSKPETLDNRGKNKRNLGELLYKFMNAFQGYYTIERFAQSKYIEIINNTELSYIDAFKKEKLLK